MPPFVRSPAETRSLLAKVLPLLASPVDAEALAAARQAVKVLDASGLSWGQILSEEAQQNSSIPANASVEAVWSRDGTRSLTPPVGTTWNETVLWLIQRKAHSPISDGKDWLDRLAIRLKRARDLHVAAALSFDEAHELQRLYLRIARPEGT